MRIEKIWFDSDYIYGQDDNGVIYKQSLLWYPKLRAANDEQRAQYSFGYDGIHWRNIDEDVSFESFGYEDAEPTAFQRFFLTHKELDIAVLAKRVGISASQLRKYINGFTRPTKETEQKLQEAIRSIGQEYTAAVF